MVDHRADPVFRAAVDGLHTSIETLAQANVPDAVRLWNRRNGGNNLQAHYSSIVPLAVWLSRRYPQHLPRLRAGTSLRHDMTHGSAEGGNRRLWHPIQQDMICYLNHSGADVVAEAMATGSPQSGSTVASTYLSTRYGGGQTSGRAGDTVLKRTLKLVAHMSLG